MRCGNANQVTAPGYGCVHRSAVAARTHFASCNKSTVHAGTYLNHLHELLQDATSASIPLTVVSAASKKHVCVIKITLIAITQRRRGHEYPPKKEPEFLFT